MSSFYKSFGKQTKYEMKPVNDEATKELLESPKLIERTKMVKVDKTDVREVVRKEYQVGDMGKDI
jgi:hypothetical protein